MVLPSMTSTIPLYIYIYINLPHIFCYIIFFNIMYHLQESIRDLEFNLLHQKSMSILV